MGLNANIQKEKWNGEILDITGTTENLGSRKCSQVLGLHALSGCNTLSFVFGKANISPLNLLDQDWKKLDCVLGEPKAKMLQQDLIAVDNEFFLSLYGQGNSSSLREARLRLFSTKNILEKSAPNRQTRVPSCPKSLSPNDVMESS